MITPTRNRADFLPRAVHSVLTQTHSRLELVVVDDGSEDATHEYLSSVRDPRLRIISQTPQGVAAARNAGIAQSNGECIALLDSDDCWHARKLERQLAFTRSGGWQITQTEEIWVRNGRRVNPGKRHRKRSGWIFGPSLELCLVSPSCVLMTRRCFEHIGPFDTRLLACEDYDLWLRCTLFYPVGLVPFALTTRYAGHADQLSAKIIGLDLYRIISLNNLLKRPEISEEQRCLVQDQLDMKVTRYVQGCRKRGKEEEAKRILDLVTMGEKTDGG